MAHDFVDLCVEIKGRDAALCAGVETETWGRMVSLLLMRGRLLDLTIDVGS